MSAELGPMTFDRSSALRYLPSAFNMGAEQSFSEETARRIDAEVGGVLQSQHVRAGEILRGKRAALERIAHALLERETIERTELEALVHGDASPSQ
jgi:cell division protease FtsH